MIQGTEERACRWTGKKSCPKWERNDMGMKRPFEFCEDESKCQPTLIGYGSREEYSADCERKMKILFPNGIVETMFEYKHCHLHMWNIPHKHIGQLTLTHFRKTDDPDKDPLE